MSYTYKFIPASMGMIPKAGNTPKDHYNQLFQETLDEQFYNAGNWFTIKAETEIGSEIYENIDVRIAHVINTETGLKLGNDWKTLLFKNVNEASVIGQRYIFDNNTWLTVNVEVTKNLTGTSTIRRCNNTLRWIDEKTGAYYEEPCCIEPLVKEPRDYYTQGSAFTTPGGFLHIYAQLNNRSNLINENQRFLFGNQNHWTCYKVIGTGINDFTNTETYDNDSAKIIVVDMIANFVNPDLDDVINGIADVHTNLYRVSLNKEYVESYPGSSIQLTESVTYNGYSVTREMEWETSNPIVASVNNEGLVSLITTGSAIITTSIASSASSVEFYNTSASCLVLVTETPIEDNEIIITPDINYVLENSTREYEVALYENGTPQSGSFVITCSDNGVPLTSYTFQQTSGSSFAVTNYLKNLESYIIITCSSGSSISKDYNIHLRGAW